MSLVLSLQTNLTIANDKIFSGEGPTKRRHEEEWVNLGTQPKPARLTGDDILLLRSARKTPRGTVRGYILCAGEFNQRLLYVSSL